MLDDIENLAWKYLTFKAVITDSVGRVRITGTYINKLEEGEFIHYDESGNISGRRFYIHGRSEGLAIITTSSSKTTIRYKNGRKCGWQTNIVNGNLLKKEHYYNGKLHGKSYHYYPNGSIGHEKTYHLGVRVGIERTFTSNGKVIHYNEYDNLGLLHGFSIRVSRSIVGLIFYHGAFVRLATEEERQAKGF